MFNEGNNLSELNLIEFVGGRSQFSQDVQDGLNERRRLVGKVSLEEGDDITESSLRLDETRGVSSQGGQKFKTLFTSSNSFSVVLGGGSVSFIFFVIGSDGVV